MTERTAISGWGRTAVTSSYLHRLRAADAGSDSAAVASLVRQAGGRGILARGLGRSYGDAAQNAGGSVVLLGEGEISLDPTAQLVTVGAGVSLDRLIRTLLPEGFFVPVTPGTRSVTIGGAIAADVHGKNHHVDGSFGAHVVALTMVLGNGEVVDLDPIGTPAEFWATIGGMGLTGIIVSATVRVRPVETAYVRVDTDRAANLTELLSLMREGDDDYTYSVAWLDLLSRGSSLGRAVLTRGHDASLEDLSEHRARRPLVAPGQRRVRPPDVVPSRLMGRRLVRAFNEVWYHKAPQRRRDEIVHVGSFFHPLDGVAEWNRLYGRRGLMQYQFVVPTGAESVLEEAVRRIADEGHASFLAVLKRMGPANPGLLSFPLPGWTLALDLPADPVVAGQLDGLDALVAEAGGRIYLAKDSRARPAVVQKMYPALGEFQRVRRQLDPGGVFTSDLARRLRL